MIEIRIDGQLLYIAKKTTLQLEVNNSAFCVSKIEGDIVFTFDVPAVENDLVFRHARFVYVERCKKYACAVSIDGVEIGYGDLYIQKATCMGYSCGLVINPFPPEFAENKLSQNDYGNDYIISAATSEHKQGWLNMLTQSLQENAIFKFPLFIDTVFYGSSNSDFGWFLLPSDPNPAGNKSGFQASINTDDSVGLDRCYINRLFTNASGVVTEALSGNRGVRVFNNHALNNPNSFAFAPAIKLLWILENVIKTGGYQIIGNFRDENNIKKIYSQSMRALDSAGNDFTTLENPFVSILPVTNFGKRNDSYVFSFLVNNIEYNSLEPSISGDYNIEISLETFLPNNFLGTFTYWDGKPGEDALILMLYDFDEPRGFPAMFEIHNVNTFGFPGWKYGSTFYPFLNYYKVYRLPRLQSEIGYNGKGNYSFNFSFTQNLVSGKKYGLFFGKIGVVINPGNHEIIDWTKTNIDANDNQPLVNIVNIFSNKIMFAQHVPALSNSDFISNICNTFGLSMFVDSAKGQIEFSFFKDILAYAQAIDLSQYLLTKKSYIEKYESKKYLYKFDTINSEDMDETKILPPVKAASLLPDAFINFGKICFVENENRYHIAVRVGDATQNWVFKWEAYCGNNQILEIGEGDSEEISLCKIPNMKIADEKIENKNFILNIEMEGCSPIFDTSSKDFEMVLINYIGRKKLSFGNYYYEHASPVCLDVNGNTQQGVSLTAIGESSVGETYAAPWLRFLASHEKISHTFLLPVSIFMEVLQLLKPQDVPIRNQIRFVIIDSVKLMPIKMNFQFTEGSKNVIAEILFAKEMVGD